MTPTRPVHLILFSRAPVAGATKTRLAAGLGAEAARDFHVACLHDVLEEAAAWRADAPAELERPVRVHAFLTPAGSQGDFARAGIVWPPTVRLWDQAGDTLGARMHGALQAVLAEEPGTALLIGTDLPLFRRALLSAAVHALERADVVFGPTLDGGYYLVGLRQPRAELFERPAWGERTVLHQSLAAAQGLRTVCIAALPDVDVAADALRVLADPACAALDGRRAVRLLRRWVAEGRVGAQSPRAGA